jgi:hypothetical protein
MTKEEQTRQSEQAKTILAMIVTLKSSKEYLGLKHYYDLQREKLIMSAKTAEPGTARQTKAIATLDGWDQRDRFEDFMEKIAKSQISVPHAQGK